jgi:putative transmembrane protein PGPGW
MKVVRLAGGFGLLGLGMVMLVTPGPGLLSIAAGVALLADDYEWARRWRDRLRESGHRLAQHFSKG